MGPRRQVNNKTAWWGQENAADNKMAKQMAISEITAQAQSAKNVARTNVLEKINPKMGTRLSYSPKGGKTTLPKGDKQVVRSHR